MIFVTDARLSDFAATADAFSMAVCSPRQHADAFSIARQHARILPLGRAASFLTCNAIKGNT